MSELLTAQQLVGEMKAVIAAHRNATLNDQCYISTISSTYSGGNPKLIDAGELVDSTETLTVLAPYAQADILASDKVLVMPVGDGRTVLGRVATLTSGKAATDGFWAVPSPHPETLTTVTATANQTRAVRMYLPCALLVSKIIFEVTTLINPSNSSFGIYSGGGSAKLVDSGLVDTSTTGIKTVTLGTAVQLYPGFHLFAFTSDSAVAFRALALATNAPQIWNTGATQRGVGTASSGGALPSSLGTLSSSNVTQFPVMIFQA